MKTIVKYLCLAAIGAFVASSVSAATEQAAQSKAITSNKNVSRQVKAGQPARAPVRTLDAIRIEGEIAVPQVLFITSRDNRRYSDGLGATLRKNTLEVARSIDLPAGLHIVARSGQHKEAGR